MVYRTPGKDNTGDANCNSTRKDIDGLVWEIVEIVMKIHKRWKTTPGKYIAFMTMVLSRRTILSWIHPVLCLPFILTVTGTRRARPCIQKPARSGNRNMVPGAGTN